MKSNKTLVVLTACVVSLACVQPAGAGDREWATAGKVLTGVVAGSILLNALDCVASPPPPTVVYSPAPVVYAPAPAVVYAPAPRPVVYAQPVVYAAPPVVYYSRPAPYYYPRRVVYSYPVPMRHGPPVGRPHHHR